MNNKEGILVRRLSSLGLAEYTAFLIAEDWNIGALPNDIEKLVEYGIPPNPNLIDRVLEEIKALSISGASSMG